MTRSLSDPFGQGRQGIAQEMNPTALPRGAVPSQLDGGFQALVGARGSEVSSVKTPFSEITQKPCPGRFCFTVTHVKTGYFPAPVTANIKGDHDSVRDGLPGLCSRSHGGTRNGRQSRRGHGVETLPHPRPSGGKS